MAFTENLSRRRFLSAGALALTPSVLPRLNFGPNPANPQAGASIIQRKLGRTGLQVPIVSMGVMNADNPAVVKRSYEIGVRLFDTAMGYQGGRNEQMIGSVINDLGVRDKVLIQTKIKKPRLASTATAEEISRQMLNDFDGCLKRLQSDYVDILLIHGPNVSEMNDPGVMQALSEAKKQKRARFIGVSTHAGQASVLEDAAKTKFYDTVTVSFNFTQAEDSALIGAIKKAAADGIGIIAMKTQATGRMGPSRGAPVNQTAALKWVLNHPEIATAIPGYTNFEHMTEDFSVAYGLKYTEEEKKFLAEKNLRAEIQFCQQCGRCLSTCSRGVDIPTLMRTHMYAARYGNFLHARATLEEIEENAHLRLCASCEECSARCFNDTDIAANIGDLKALFL
ncbi:MAG: aldo/keto reductase [Acidobacteria bacterium]|nr:aldo/keto reductase [Acidobacteriota bacterium]